MLLSALLAHPPLGLELATPGARLDRQVKGAHAIDLVQPAPWIASGYVVLTTGIALRGNAERQRDFVHSIADVDGAALGLGVDVVFKTMPRPFLEAAEARSLPLFTVPYEIPFRDIIRFVTAATLRDEAGHLARVIAIQDDLLGIIERGGDETEVVERVGRLLDARVVLFAPDGRVVALAGHPPLKELWGLIASGARAMPLPPRGHVLVRDVEVAGETRYHLAVLLRSAARAETVARPVAGFAVRVLQIFAVNRALAVENERLERSGLLQDLLASERIDRRVLARLRSFGLDLTQPTSVAVATPPACTEALDRLLARDGLPRLVGPADGDVVALWQGTLSPDALEGVDLAIGIADPVADPHDLPRALTEARACLAVGRATGASVVTADSLALADAVVANLGARNRTRVDDALAPLDNEKAHLLETLIAFFEHDMDINSCANALHLHPNSLRYRLAKVEAKLGRSLRSPATIADLHLALRARALRQPEAPM